MVPDFAINQHGTYAHLLQGDDALPEGYYAQVVPRLLRLDPRALTPVRRGELDRLGVACRARPELGGMVQVLFDRLLPRAGDEGAGAPSLNALLEKNGFDGAQHEQIRAEMRRGRIGLAQTACRPAR